ncbi:hypothetical protein EPO17_03760, partial [Patescibacteria group bacterium]
MVQSFIQPHQKKLSMNKRELRRERILQEAVNRDLAVTKLVRSSPEDVVSGWCPAITDNLGNAWFECALMPWGADNKWRVSCRGGDDTAYERVSMTEA